VPIQLDGNYVTVIWFTEMLLLLWMWRQFKSTIYFVLAFALSILGFASLVHDWTGSYMNESIRYMLPLWIHRYFITGLVAVLAYWLGWTLVRRRVLAGENSNGAANTLRYLLLGLALITTYFTFLNELMLYFSQAYHYSIATINGNYGYSYEARDHSWKIYQALWGLLYSGFFVVLAGMINERFFHSRQAAWVSWAFTLFTLFIAMVFGLPLLEGLRAESHTPYNGQLVRSGADNGFRYLYYLGLIARIAMIYRFRNDDNLKALRVVNTRLFHVAILVLLSAELTNLFVYLNQSHTQGGTLASYYRKVSYRMGYTVLWGLYSMGLITYGIVRRNKTLRILAISLFGLTILKLAIDAVSMTAGYRLIVFITIGVILLLVSFLYQKFKTLLFGSDTIAEEHETTA